MKLVVSTSESQHSIGISQTPKLA